MKRRFKLKVRMGLIYFIFIVTVCLLAFHNFKLLTMPINNKDNSVMMMVLLSLLLLVTLFICIVVISKRVKGIEFIVEDDHINKVFKKRDKEDTLSRIELKGLTGIEVIRDFRGRVRELALYHRDSRQPQTLMGLEEMEELLGSLKEILGDRVRVVERDKRFK